MPAKFGPQELGVDYEKTHAALEAQFEQRKLWDERVEVSMKKIKDSGVNVITIADKTPFQNAVKPVWDKYGSKYTALVKRIQDTK